MSHQSNTNDSHENLPGEDGPSGPNAAPEAVLPQQRSEGTHREINPAERGEIDSGPGGSGTGLAEVRPLQLPSRLVQQARLLEQFQQISLLRAASRPRSPPRYRYLSILVPIEDLIDRLSRREQKLITRVYRNLDNAFSLIRDGPNLRNTHNFHPSSQQMRQDMALAVQQLMALDPHRFSTFRQNLLDDRSDLYLQSNNPLLRQLALTDLLDRLGRVDVLSFVSEGPGSEASQCLVCLVDYTLDDFIIVLPCHPTHHFHRNCIEGTSSGSSGETMINPRSY
ncbi:hypothetical protein PGT21_010991 [Puccinia graminis f. sp. tritici]|uniref:RING-type domain-containing protein n=1 Tax=Puccinia graminis f. sp. tritici TaxID=56615 RepID=A0A5B0Q2N3_PUCGR|nr:hypothetical protein PGT21_010991 [Puccinia graminis f. sp. tritici]